MISFADAVKSWMAVLAWVSAFSRSAALIARTPASVSTSSRLTSLAGRAASASPARRSGLSTGTLSSGSFSAAASWPRAAMTCFAPVLPSPARPRDDIVVGQYPIGRSRLHPGAKPGDATVPLVSPPPHPRRQAGNIRAAQHRNNRRGDQRHDRPEHREPEPVLAFHGERQ